MPVQLKLSLCSELKVCACNSKNLRLPEIWLSSTSVDFERFCLEIVCIKLAFV